MANQQEFYEKLMNDFMLKHGDWDKEVIYTTTTTINEAKQIHDSIKNDIKTIKNETFAPVYKAVIPFAILQALIYFLYFNYEWFPMFSMGLFFIGMWLYMLKKMGKAFKADVFFTKHSITRQNKAILTSGLMRLQYNYILDRLKTCKDSKELHNLQELENKLAKRLRIRR